LTIFANTTQQIIAVCYPYSVVKEQFSSNHRFVSH